MDRRERKELISRLQHDAWSIASHFGLSYSAIKAEHPRVKSRYGVCFSDGMIKIRLNHARTGRPLKYSSLIDTLCHELAHLKHFNHGPEFKSFYFRVLGWARRQGIYKPSPRGSGDRAAAARPAPDTSGPRVRNGVPVFARDDESLSLELPWETAPEPARTSESKKPPSDSAGDETRQLSLF